MYESFFELQRRPFSATPDADFFVALPAVQDTLDRLLYCVFGGQGIAVLTAPAGTGKTQLCQRLLAELGESFVGVYLANSNFPTCRSLLQAILYELGHPYIRMAEQELRLELTTAVKSLRSSQPKRDAVVLVLDEAHLLSERSLEEVRAITNIAEGGQTLVRVVLAGQLRLEEKLTSPALAALNQRIRCQVSLDPLTRQESADYVAGRLALAGADVSNVFTPQALQAICHASDGLPRCLNQLCDHSLMLACMTEQKPVEATTVQAALADLRQLPLRWNESMSATAPIEERQETGGDSNTHAQSGTAAAPPMTVEAGGEVACIEFGSTEESEQTATAFEAAGVGATQQTGNQPGSEDAVDMTATDEHLIGLRLADVDRATAESVSLFCGPSLGPGGQADIEREWDSVSLVFEPPDEFAEVSTADDEDEAESQEVRHTLEMPAAQEPKRETLRNGEFEEETVFDRYAMLDAGLSVPEPAPAAVEECDSLLAPPTGQHDSEEQEDSSPEQEPAPAADVAATPHEAEYEIAGGEGQVSIEPAGIAERAFGSFGDDLLREPHPDAILDDVMPLLDDLIQPTADFETFPPAIFEAGGEDFDSERTIIECLNEANSLIAETDLLAVPTPEEIAELTEFARAAEYDVVQPEPVDDRNVEVRIEDPAEDVENTGEDKRYPTDEREPHRPYAQLFSRLRQSGQWQA